MKRKLFIVLLAIVASLCLAFGLAACSDIEEEDGSTGDFGDSSEETGGLSYQTNADLQSYSVVGIGEAATTHIVIPSTYNGLPVTGIAANAFNGITGLTSIAIPESITYIGDYAFFGCTSLDGVYITDLTAWCNISFGDLMANPLLYAHNLYLYDELITELVIPEGVTSINSSAFTECTSLTSVSIPNSVTSIGRDAFSGCSSLTSVTFENTSGWWYASRSSATSGTSILSSTLADPSTAATYLTSKYCNYYWYCS